ncbi:MAG: hypothetical protein JNM19_01230, partial [Chitinophagaceae bacterium]|nr:hypothetical protein [Chitinophagaceae bacterium]
NQLDGFLVQKNPQAMLWVAAEWYQRRSRFNVYYFDDEDFRNLLRRLTHLDIGVLNDKGEFTFLYDDDYYAEAKLNLLVYWSNHYQDYRWNDQLGYFENTKEKGVPKSREEMLFPALLSDDDTAALLAFRELAQLDPVIIKEVVKDYDRTSFDRNYALPTFPFDFLPPLATLTQYCRNNGFSYALPAWLEDSLALVTDFPHFAVKYRVENNILDRLSVADITALEFYGLTGNDYDRATFSLGRILDKFYSLHLEEISSDPKQLSLFLLKAKLFNELSIIGNCNKYMKKFERCKPIIIERLKQLQQTTADTLTRQLCEEALAVNANYKPWQVSIPSRGESYNEVYGVTDLEAKYARLMKKFPDPEKRVMHVPVLMGDISYSQIGQAVKLLLKDTAMDRYYRFHFLEADFGIPFDSFEEDTINAFLSAYALYKEKDLYAYYLKRNGIRCFDNAGNLDFAGVYDILKYGVVDAFQGGGGGKRDDGVYAVIKLLEFHFNTRLGFARKRCKSGYGYSCSTTTEAAAAWMQFLEAKKLVTGVEQDPVSFSPNK